MQFKNPIGQLITDDGIQFHVVGVIKDYIQESPFQPIKPMIIKGPASGMGVILVKLNGRRPMTQDVADMEKIFKDYNPAYPFEFTFTDEEYARKFMTEQFVGKLAMLFTGLIILISCIGLFGLAAYTAHARIKEIGVRKVLGASVSSIVVLLSRDFVKLVLVAVVIATPVAWLLMNDWLMNYDYRVPVGWTIFIMSGGVAILIAVLTVSYQAIRAAIANPVKSLRTE
jgi:putative ABC transport system permease protein